MTDIEQIQSIRSQTLAQLDALRADPEADVLDRRPARSLAGVRRSLQRTVDWCDRKLAEYQPFEVRSQGMT